MCSSLASRFHVHVQSFISSFQVRTVMLTQMIEICAFIEGMTYDYLVTVIPSSSSNRHIVY